MSIDDSRVETVAAGDVLLVRPGEVIPLDDAVIGGTAAVDESAHTGEPLAETRAVRAADGGPKALSPRNSRGYAKGSG